MQRGKNGRQMSRQSFPYAPEYDYEIATILTQRYRDEKCENRFRLAKAVAFETKQRIPFLNSGRVDNWPMPNSV